jgi:hypothetical protein
MVGVDLDRAFKKKSLFLKKKNSLNQEIKLK